MDIIAQLRTLTDQLMEQFKLLEENYNQYSQSERNLENCCQDALDNLKYQLQRALGEGKLPELKLAIPNDKFDRISRANDKKRELETKRVEITEIIGNLNNQRHNLLKDNFDVLEDFGSNFWKVCIHQQASFYFMTDKLRIKSPDGEFEVPYRRFTEPKEVILAEIAPLVEEMKINQQIRDLETEITALKLKLKETKKRINA